MNDAESNFDMTTSCEGSEELNGKEASFRGAAMVSEPRIIQKMYRNGALVPMGSYHETPHQ